MFPVLVLIFLVVPIVEIFFLIQIGQILGAWWTIILVILTALIGVRLLKLQGIPTLLRAQEKIRSGQMPAQEMLEGIALIIAGTFLLTPGFLTDSIGFCLLLPTIRRWTIHKIIAARFVQPASQESDVIDNVPYKREE